MQRRRLLAALASGTALLAGCSAGDGGESPGTVTPYDVPTDRPGTSTPTDRPTGGPDCGRRPGEFGDRYAVVNLSRPPRTVVVPDGGVSIGRPGLATLRVELAARPTATRPLVLELAVRNEAAEPRRFPMGTEPPFVGRRGRQRSGDAELWLVPPEGRGSAVVPDERGDCWRATGRPDRGGVTRAVRLGPCEEASRRYALLGAPGNDGCLPPGEYVFGDDDHGGFAVAVWDSTSPGPEEPSRFAGRSVPDLPGFERTRWFHAANEETEVYLRPERERHLVPETLIDLALVNHSTSTLSGNWHRWRLYKLHEGRWYDVDLAPRPIPGVLNRLQPGETHNWHLHVAGRGLAGDAPGRESTGTAVARGWLGGGLYAFGVGTGTAGGSRTGVAALLRREAPPVEVTPTRDARRLRREGETLVVASGRGGEATLVVERTTDGEPVITEQVARLRGWRNTLPFLLEDDSLRRVRLRTLRQVARRAVRGDGSRSVRFRGEAFVARTEGNEASP